MKTFSEYVREVRRINEEQKLKDQYEAIFKKLLDEFGVDSPAELPDEKKVEFFEKLKDFYTKGKGPTKLGKKFLED